MEEKELLRTENDENQDLNATTEASSEAQPNVSETNSEMQEKDEKAEKSTENEAVELHEEEKVKPTEEKRQPAEEKPQTESEENSVAEMMVEIESTNTSQEEEAETEATAEEETESEEKIEAEYANLPIEDAVEELHRIVADPNYNKIKTRVGILRVKILNQLKEPDRI